jgi:hypothetical protein
MSVPPVFQNILSTTCDECGNTQIILYILSKDSIEELIEMKALRVVLFKAATRMACAGLLMYSEVDFLRICIS